MTATEAKDLAIPFCEAYCPLEWQYEALERRYGPRLWTGLPVLHRISDTRWEFHPDDSPEYAAGIAEIHATIEQDRENKMTTTPALTTTTPAQKIAAELNAMRGSSASGLLVIVDLEAGTVGSTLFSRGTKPSLQPTERLIRIGLNRWTSTLVEDLR